MPPKLTPQRQMLFNILRQHYPHEVSTAVIRERLNWITARTIKAQIYYLRKDLGEEYRIISVKGRWGSYRLERCQGDVNG